MSGVVHGLLASLAGVVRDTFFRYVSLLLNTTSTNGAQNNTFLDGSTNAFSITRNGNTTQGTFSPFSQTGWSNYFDGTGDYLSNAYNAVFDFGTGDFTVELWVYIAGNSTADVDSNRGVNLINSFGASSVVGWNFGLIGNTTTTGTGILFDYWNPITSLNGTLNRATVTVPQNQWNHVAATRSSGTLRIFLNGTSQTISTSNVGTAYSEANASTNGIKVGASINTSYPGALNGYISNARIVKGTAVYTSNFTPPTSPLTAITNTSLLTCQSNRFIDNSSNAFAISATGTPSVQAFSPFNPTAAWSASTNGGSGYFDGNGDELNAGSNAAFSFGTGAYTVEAWVYLTAAVSATHQPIFVCNHTTNGFTFWNENTVGQLQIASSGIGAVLSSATTLSPNIWNHIVAVRSGTGANQTAIFVNGTRVANGTDATNWSITGPLKVGGITAANYYLTGYASNVRVVKGTAVYDPTLTTLTVPTAPLTAIANTSLLLNFTNAGIYDSASGNDLETVGNAQVSTTQAKWGTTSMAFDGTGDSLTAVDSPRLELGASDFTIEMWAYYNAVGGASGRGTLSKGSTTGASFLIFQGAANELAFYASSNGTTWDIASAVQFSSNIPLNTWHHLAVTRSGSTFRVFLNGTQTNTFTSTASLVNNTAPVTVGAYGSLVMDGYIDDLRITNGYARYTANFTAPTAAFPLQ